MTPLYNKVENNILQNLLSENNNQNYHFEKRLNVKRVHQEIYVLLKKDRQIFEKPLDK